MFSSDRPSWKNPKVLATLILVFLAGSCVGAAVMARVVHRLPPSERLSFEQLKSELDLTPQQAGKVEMILNDFARYDRELHTQVEDYRALGKTQILQILNADQKERFARIAQKVLVR